MWWQWLGRRGGPGPPAILGGTVRLPEITGAVADEAKDLPGLVRQTQTTMRELERLGEALRTWLLRKCVNPTNPPPSHPPPDTAVPDKKPLKSTHLPGGVPN